MLSETYSYPQTYLTAVNSALQHLRMLIKRITTVEVPDTQFRVTCAEPRQVKKNMPGVLPKLLHMDRRHKNDDSVGKNCQLENVAESGIIMNINRKVGVK